jgi:signal transduction histidine kinase
LDTNLKKNNIQEDKKQGRKKFILSAWSTLLIILILSVVSVGVYAPLKDYIFQDDIENYLESRDFAYTLTGLTDYMTNTKLQGNDGYYIHRYENVKNIKYYIRNDSKDITISNMKDSPLEAEIKKSQFYLHVITDENGNPVLKEAPDSFNKRAFLDNFNRLKERATETHQEEVSIQEKIFESSKQEKEIKHKNYLANLELIYTVPENLTNNNDLFITNLRHGSIGQYASLMLLIGGIGILVLTILAFLIPYFSQKQLAVVKAFNNMYLEFKVLTWIFLALACTGIIVFIGNINVNSFDIIDVIYEANWVFYLIGIPMTFAIYSLLYLSICYIKHVYHTGLMEGFLKNILLIKICVYLFNNIKRTIDQIADADITQDCNKKLIKLLGINFLALIIIVMSGTLGPILAICYTVFLFKYLIKILDKVRDLNEASSQLAKGDFDIVLPEDMGILSPFSKSLNNIKEVFKVAVDKEVKSQNMKTQLISNVSHDLKTPLTSIITYVDLLKKEDLDENTKKEYIDVLDQKSKRLKVLIEDLFEVSKASSGNIELDLEEVDVIALLRQTLGEMEEKITESTLHMRTNFPENKVFCKLDGARTYRVFENIIGNILKYAMPNTRVYINAEENEKEVFFTFKNISNYEMNFEPTEMMERFTRGDESRNTDGSGLGLAIARSLVELQNGNLDITVDGDLFKLKVIFPKLR